MVTPSAPVATSTHFSLGLAMLVIVVTREAKLLCDGANRQRLARLRHHEVIRHGAHDVTQLARHIGCHAAARATPQRPAAAPEGGAETSGRVTSPPRGRNRRRAPGRCWLALWAGAMASGAAAAAGASEGAPPPSSARTSDDRGPIPKPATHPGKHNFLIWRVLFEVRRGAARCVAPQCAAFAPCRAASRPTVQNPTQ